ncbi:exo-beta-1,3-glucanase [Panaeolus papilionaceus]|nr:exo-beta-1,3-glucanase [Panaeolus papilionaceus]
MWDTHIRTAGFRGSNLESDACPKVTPSALAACQAAFLSLHITKHATGYFEGTWVWLADHDLDTTATGEEQLTAYSGRGILSESQGPVWMIGTASEHHVIYQYNLVGARDHYMGLIQTESPYWQPSPSAPAPFTINTSYSDPTPYASVASAWALNVDHSHNILVYGAGLYSFFDNYSQDCITTRTCQHQTVNIDQESDVEIYSLSTVSTVNMLSMEAQGVVKAEDNLNGFVSSMSAWRKEK